MAGTYSIPVTEARGVVATSSNVDQLAIVLGCTSKSAASGVLGPFYGSGSAAVTGEGYGDAVDALCQIIEQRQDSGSASKRTAAFYALPIDTAGSYGAIDDSGITGTVEILQGSTEPYGTHEAYVIFMTSGTIGVDGILYKSSLNDGRNLSRTTALSTATSILIPNSNVTLELGPTSANQAALFTLTNEIFGDFNSHVVDVTGSPAVHGAADNDDVLSGTTYPSATTIPTAIARLNAVRAAYLIHQSKTADGVHGTPDATNNLVAPIADNAASAIALALDLKAKLNAHFVFVSTVHGSAATQEIVASSPGSSGATVVAGDIVRVRTFAPQPASGDIATAFIDIANSSANIGLIVCEFPVDATLAAVIKSGRAELLARGKRVTVLTRTRIPDFENDETDVEWVADIAEDFSAYDDSTMCVRAVYGLITDAMTGHQYLRSDLAQWAADVARTPRSTWPNAPADQPEANFSLVNSSGTTIGHDEGPRGAFTGLSDEEQGNRFSCVQRLPNPTRAEDVYSTVPWVMFAADERIQNLQTRRIANAIERVAVDAGTTNLGGKLFYVPAAGATPAMLTDASVRAIQGVIFSALAAEFRNDIQNWNDAALDTGLVQVNPIVTVSGGNLLSVPVTLSPKVFGYLLSLPITLSVQE